MQKYTNKYKIQRRKIQKKCLMHYSEERKIKILKYIFLLCKKKVNFALSKYKINIQIFYYEKN